MSILVCRSAVGALDVQYIWFVGRLWERWMISILVYSWFITIMIGSSVGWLRCDLFYWSIRCLSVNRLFDPFIGIGGPGD
jgi:hypothetical protein